MKHRTSAKQQLTAWALVTLALFFYLLPAVAQEQDGPRLRLIDSDASGFPQVSVAVLTLDGRSAPINDFSRLTLRENGTPIPDFTTRSVPVGMDAVLVLDANDGFNVVDDESGLSRREKVQESVRRWATLHMNQEGLDQVTVVVPNEDGLNGRFLIQNARRPEEVIAAVDSYDPARLRATTPLNAMLALALEAAQPAPGDGRYRAILLFTDGGQLDEQLSYPILVAQAQDAGVPIYGAIVGARADEQETSNIQRLTEPTRATFVHMPNGPEVDPIYEIWRAQSSPPQLSYRSVQRQSGQVSATVSLDGSQVVANFSVTLAAPQAALQVERSPVRRVGTAPDTPLAVLQPTLQPVTVALTWPDEQPRALRSVTLFENGRRVLTLDSPPLTEAGGVLLNWDVSELDAGPVELVAQLTDELGFQATTAPVPVKIVVERPSLPTATAVPPPSLALPNVTLPTSLFGLTLTQWGALLGGALLLLVVVRLARRQPQLKAQPPAPPPPKTWQPPRTDMPQSSGAKGLGPLAAFLEPLGRDAEALRLTGANLTLGRDTASAQLVLDDPSISRLHARVRRSGGEFWLYDEGSQEGTFLNFERLGLAPRPLQDGDTVQFGRLTFRFRLRPDDASEEGNNPQT